MKSSVLAGLVAVAAVAGAVGYWHSSRPRPNPARELMAHALPRWQTARARPGSLAGSEAVQALQNAASPWPKLADALLHLDAVWPDDKEVRAAAKSTNQALREAGLGYFVNVQPVRSQPIVLTYEVAARIPWRIGERAVEVVRLRRLDTLNIELGLLGETEEGLPVVLLDRIEASLASELPAVYDPSPGAAHSAAAQHQRNDFDRAALGRVRRLFDTRVGSELAKAANLLRQRDALLESMRGRFHGGTVQLNSPDGFVLGEPWLSGLTKYTELTRPGGPLMLDTDLRNVTRADEELRADQPHQALAAVLDFTALATEAHEARHALDEIDPVGPPPPALFEVMGNSEARFVSMADKELRAYLGELHDSPAPACYSLTKMLRGVYGRGARRTPHFYATITILHQLDENPDRSPIEYLNQLCDLPDGELRQRAATAWQKLYQVAQPPGTRGQPAPGAAAH